MMDWLSSRLLLALLYLGVLFAGGLLLLGQLRLAEGDLLVAEGATESVLVRESTGRRGFGALHGLPAEAIPFDNPRVALRRLDRNGTYDMVQLPFHVRLNAVEVLKTHPARDALRVGKDMELGVGETANTSMGVLRFVSSRPWTGLLPEPGGQPAVRVSIRETAAGPWETVALAESTWTRCGEAIVQMTWSADEAAARAALPRAYDPRTLAEWRVRDGDKEQHFTSLTPGTGLTLSDGSEARLMQFDAAGDHDPQGRPCIRLRFTTGDTHEDVWIPANDGTDPRVFFRCPTGSGPVVFVRAFGYNEAWVRVFSDGVVSGTRLFAAGEIWRVAGMELRLDEALAGALIIRAEDKAVYEAVVEVDGERRFLREGASIALDDGTPLVYHRTDVPPEVRLDLTLLSSEMNELGTIRLVPGARRRFGNWQFIQAENTRNVLHSAVIHVCRTLNRPAAWVGLACFVTGAVGLTIARLRRPRRKRPRRLMPPVGESHNKGR